MRSYDFFVNANLFFSNIPTHIPLWSRPWRDHQVLKKKENHDVDIQNLNYNASSDYQ